MSFETKVIISLTERRTLGSSTVTPEVVIDVVGSRECNINYPIGASWSEVMMRYPSPFDYLHIFSIDELAGLETKDVERVELLGFEELYSLDQMSELRSVLFSRVG
jgi:hypothetical protein